MQKKILLILYIGILSTGYVLAQEAERPRPLALIGFYNLENLFDAVDDPAIRDEEFLPEGRNGWSSERYQEKILQLAKVIKSMGGGPDILGVAEVENRAVLEDLVQTPALAANHYQIIHFDSPDQRGIDVALIYKPSVYKPFVVRKIPFVDTNQPDYKTRDMLWVKGLFHGDTLHVVVNHWPSRWGSGQVDKRNLAGDILRHAVDSVQSTYAEAKVVIMGDFNDDPSNASIAKHLNADSKIKKLEKGQLYNTAKDTFKKGLGTLAYHGTWNLFDQIIISQSLLQQNADKYYYLPDSYAIFGPDWMRVQEGPYKGAPFRTFASGVYAGGYSDHFPALITIAQ